MKFIGIDYGEKKIGIALSDKEGQVAFPKLVIKNKGIEKTALEIGDLMEKWEVEEVVVGRSSNLKGEDNLVMREVRSFVDTLKRKTEKEVHLEPEFYTSLEAGRITGRTGRLDAQAAAIILQSFINKKNQKK